MLLVRKSQEAARAHRRTFAGALTVLVLLTFIIRRHNGYVVPLSLAVQAVADNRLDNAIWYANQILEKRAHDPAASVLLGDIYIQKEEYDRAEPVLQNAVNAAPDNASALYLLGVVYLRTGRVQSALDITTKLLKIHAVGPKERGLFADAVNAKGEFDLAGEQYLSLDRYDDAIHAFQSALKQNPDDTRSKLGLIRAYRANGMNGEADALEKTTPEGADRNSKTGDIHDK